MAQITVNVFKFYIPQQRHSNILNPYMMNGLSHPYHESTFIFRGIGSDFSVLFHFLMKFILANRIAPDGTPCFAASHLGLLCLSMSIKRMLGLCWLMKKTDMSKQGRSRADPP